MEKESANVLVIEDDEAAARSVIRSLKHRSDDHVYHAAHNEREAILLAKRIEPEVIVLDLSIDPTRGPESGLSLIPRLFQFSDSARIIVLTGMSADDWGIRAINAGAASFVCKPHDADHLSALVDDGISVARLMRGHRAAEDEMLVALEELGLSTKSEVMAKALEQVAFAASHPLPVLLCGETGVGKGIVANAIHRASKRGTGPFVRLQPSFGSHDLIAAELFGHTRGAFTGARDARSGLIEEASGGTLFLDEIDALPNQTQVSLLHVLQEKEFQKLGSNQKCTSDFRLIAATNCPFEQLLSGDRLRSDFFHRIAHTVIHIPPLSERRADIPLLAQQFVDKLRKDGNEDVVFSLTAQASLWLSAQPWPGNVRELQASVERGYAQAHLDRRRCICIRDLHSPVPPKFECADGSLSEQLRSFELNVATTTFTKNRQNYSATARALGIDRKRLKRILARAGNDV